MIMPTHLRIIDPVCERLPGTFGNLEPDGGLGLALQN